MLWNEMCLLEPSAVVGSAGPAVTGEPGRPVYTGTRLSVGRGIRLYRRFWPGGFVSHKYLL